MFLAQERCRQLVKRLGTLDMRAMPTSLKHLYSAPRRATRLLRVGNRYYTIFITPHHQSLVM